MKKIVAYIILIFGVLSINSMCKGNSIMFNEKPIFERLLIDEGINSYRIPCFLVKWAVNSSDDSAEITPFLKGSRFVSIAICENAENDYSESFNRISKKLVAASYVSLAEINDGKSKISIKSLFKDDYISELVIIVNDKDEFVAISLMGKIDPREISKAINKLNKSKTIKN